MISRSSIGRNDTTTLLLVEIATFAFAVIEFKYCRAVVRQMTTIPLFRISKPQVTRQINLMLPGAWQQHGLMLFADSSIATS